MTYQDCFFLMCHGRGLGLPVLPRPYRARVAWAGDRCDPAVLQTVPPVQLAVPGSRRLPIDGHSFW